MTTTLSEIRLGERTSRNRVAFCATVTNLGLSDRITDEQVAYYEARAAGGVGLVVTEGLSVHPTSVPNPMVPRAYDEQMVEQFRRLAAAVQHHGALAIGQLWHVGRQALWSPGLAAWSPSELRDPYSGTTPHKMTLSEIREVVASYVQSARHLQVAGFDGVELHGAHGYLLTQFMSPWSNTRDDEYGGSTSHRVRIAVDIINGIRYACGTDFVVGLKLSAHEYVDGGIDELEAARLVDLIVTRSRPDYLAVSQSNFSRSLERHVPDMNFPDAPFVHLAAGVRAAADGVPVMALAKVPDLATAEALLADGTCDLVGMARPLIADAHLVRKYQEGRAARPCTYCNACWESIHSSRTVACMYAPEAGREALDRPQTATATAPEPVSVVGGGPAGLEFARTAAALGHPVTLYEARPALGGWLGFERSVPSRTSMGKALEWLEQEVRTAGVEVRTSTTIALDTLDELDGTVVVAVGSAPEVPAIPGAVAISLEEAWERRDQLDSPVVILDEVEDEPIYAIATELAAQHEVHVVTKREALARRTPFVNRIGLLRRLDEAGVHVHTLQVPSRVEDGRLVASHTFSDCERLLSRVGTLVVAGPYRSRIADYRLPTDTVVIGDASAPRGYIPVVQEAHDAARRLGELLTPLAVGPTWPSRCDSEEVS